jgi:sugar O-acyltransferase (sialic acid O-acetyltransferase NeuD family)
VPEGVRITQKALRLARAEGLDLGTLPRDALITEAVIQGLRKPPRAAEDRFTVPVVQPAFDAGSILIYGAGGHARMVIDLVRQGRQYSIAGLVADPPPKEREIAGVPVLGSGGELEALQKRGQRLILNAVGALERPLLRVEIFHRLAELGFAFPAAVHRHATVEPSAGIGAAVQVFSMAHIGAGARIGFGAIVNTGVIVSHDCVIEDYAHLTPGVVLAGTVRVGTGALIGMGVTVHMRVSIGAWARIGNAARIHADVPPHAIIPAGTTWPRD